MKQLAVIRNSHFDVEDDTGKYALVFTVWLSESVVAGQWITDWNTIRSIFADTGLHGPEELNGKVCWVLEENYMIRFIRMATM